MKDYTELYKETATKLNKKALSKSIDIEFNSVKYVKNNNVDYYGFCMRDKAHKNIYSPTIYIDPDCLEPLDKLFWNLVTMYNNHSIDSKIGDVDFNKEYISENVFPFYVNIKNKDEYILHDKAFTVSDYFDDLLISYRVKMNLSEDVKGTIQLTTKILENIGISMEELNYFARKNIRDKVMVQSIAEVLMEADIPENMIPFTELPIYVITNEDKCNGAGILESRANMGYIMGKFGNSILIPSSIHEWLLIPDNGYMSPKEINGIIESINATEVKEEEILSNHMYHIDAEKKQVSSIF